MDRLEITGPTRLQGEVLVSGAKNAALPLLAAGLMAETDLILGNMPELADTRSMMDLLAHHGLTIKKQPGQLRLSGTASQLDAPYDLVRKMRASILVLGPLLARFGKARVSLPGGCAIGTRPVDLHIRAMQQLGAVVELADGYIQARASRGLVGARIDFPFVSVGATENALMAACLARGTSLINNAAREPEIIDLAECLIKMGARISGHGSQQITIEGVDSLSGAEHDVVADRIEAGSFAIAAAMTGGDLLLKNLQAGHLAALFEVMRATGTKIVQEPAGVRITGPDRVQAVDIETAPYPGFPTDLQAQYMAMMCLAEGQARLTETIFENRFMHAPELLRMGADIQIDGNCAIVTGKPALRAAPVMATDLRASISLVLAGLATSGTTIVNRIYHLDRGYADLEAKLGGCGARLVRRSDSPGERQAGKRQASK